MIALYSPHQARPLRLLDDEQAQKLLKSKQAVLIDLEGERALQLVLAPEFDDDPSAYDLQGRVNESRETVRRAILNEATHVWCWEHKLNGEELEAWAQIREEEWRKCGIIR